MTSAIDQKTAAILAAFNSKPYKNEVVRYDAPQALTASQKAQARENIGGFSRNIGEIVTSTLPLTDAGLHLLDGSVIQGNGIYSDFVTYIAGLDQNANYFCSESEWQASVSQYGVCGKFVYDSTANTVRLPKITGITEGTTDLTALGDLVEAGLPNIEGYAHDIAHGSGDMSPTGAFASTNSWGGFQVGTSSSGSSDGYSNFKFSAQDSNTIYGNSQTVQPQTVKVLFYIVIATVTKTEIQVDIDNIVTDLNNKVDISSPQTITGNKDFTGLLQHNGYGVDAVVASGSNYIRYESGLQICFGRIENLSQTNNAWGSIYEMVVNTSTTFPMPFIETPAISAQQFNGGQQGACSNVLCNATAITQISFIRGKAPVGPTAFGYIAIGFWK